MSESTMRVLLVGCDSNRGHEVERQLAAAGHATFRCSADGAPHFPCEGLEGGHGCPLDSGIDVVLDLREQLSAAVVAGEEGVRCGIRRQVPLALIGSTGITPYTRFAHATTFGIGNAVEACHAAVRAAEQELADAAVAAAADVFAHAGVDTAVTAEVERHPEVVSVTLRPAQPVPRATATLAASRAGTAVRARATDARRVEVSVADAPPA